MILDGQVQGFGRGGKVWGRPKKANLGRNGSRRKMRENPPVKVVGGLGRSFGGSGLSKYLLEIDIHAKVPQTEISVLRNIFPAPTR